VVWEEYIYSSLITIIAWPPTKTEITGHVDILFSNHNNNMATYKQR
jgi:hypothetical protein